MKESWKKVKKQLDKIKKLLKRGEERQIKKVEKKWKKKLKKGWKK